MIKDSQTRHPAKLVIKKSELLSLMKTTEVAEALGVTKQAVSGWGEIIPELRAIKLLELNDSIPHKYI